MNPRHRTGPLAPRQTQVLRMYAQGMKEQAIANELYLSIETIRTHRKRTCRDLGAHSVAHAVAIAYQQGILP